MHDLLQRVPHIGKGVEKPAATFIANGAVIKDGAKLGANVKIYPGVEIPPGYVVADNTFVISAPTTAMLFDLLHSYVQQLENKGRYVLKKLKSK